MAALSEELGLMLVLATEGKVPCVVDVVVLEDDVS